MANKEVLYIEDHEDTQEIIALLLRREGIKVHAVSTLQDAREAVASGKYQLFLLDCVFPDGSGIDFCEEIRRSDQKTPIVFYSGKGYDFDKQAAFEAGANDYLLKPVDLDRMMSTVKRLLG